MLDTTEIAETADFFGVTEQQVRRDHLISHVLHGIAEAHVEGLVFFGGTALARTYLPTGRLSEDVDLYAPGRRAVAERLVRAVPRALRREFPGTEWSTPLVAVPQTQPGLLRAQDGLQVRIQLLDADVGWFSWPTETRDIVVRYSDVPATTLRVPTLAAFAAMKTVAWNDRHAERDLYDLAALAEAGAIDETAVSLVAEATGASVAAHMFEALPPLNWEEQLAHQVRALPPAADCLQRVRRAYGRVLGWTGHRQPSTP
jgi:predicted nucleotidyltransferase component of viral defense system